MYEHGLITPVVALAAWSLIMLIWLYATRIPAMTQANIKASDLKPGVHPTLPLWASNVADNYNHLMEQPTIFYAVALFLYVTNKVDGTYLIAAWVFAVFRILHSAMHCTANIVLVRFWLYCISALAVWFMVVRAAANVLI